MKPTPYHEYQIAPELRRCCWYIILGAFVLGILVYWIAFYIHNGNTEAITFFLKLFGLLVASMAFPLRWKLRVDQFGVSRRILFWWDSWTWMDLSSGRICKLHPYTLRDPERPWWRRKFRLSYMASRDIQEVISAINMHYTLPAPPVVPHALTIKYGRCSSTFDDIGIHLMIRDTPHEYKWCDICDIHIIRMDPLRRDFKYLLITLPDQEIELKLISHQGGTSRSWRGATAEEINEFLLHTVTTDRIHISIKGQPLAKREYVERELQQAEKRKCNLLVICVISTFLFVAILIWCAFANGILLAVIYAVMLFIFPGLVHVFILRFHTRQIENLNDMLKSYGDNSENPLGKTTQ